MRNLFGNLKLIDKKEKYCCGITMPQAYAIEAIAGCGRYTMKELSKQIGVTKSTATRIIDVLIRDGMVKRVSDKRDKRKVYIELTRKGNDISAKLQSCYEEYIEKVLKQIPVNKKKEIVKCLQVLNDAVKSVRGQCC